MAIKKETFVGKLSSSYLYGARLHNLSTQWNTTYYKTMPGVPLVELCSLAATYRRAVLFLFHPIFSLINTARFMYHSHTFPKDGSIHDIIQYVELQAQQIKKQRREVDKLLSTIQPKKGRVIVFTPVYQKEVRHA